MSNINNRNRISRLICVTIFIIIALFITSVISAFLYEPITMILPIRVVEYFLLYDHIEYENIDYYWYEADLKPDDVIPDFSKEISISIVNSKCKPYGENRIEKAFLCENDDNNIYIYYDSCYFVSDKSLALEPYNKTGDNFNTDTDPYNDTDIAAVDWVYLTECTEQNIISVKIPMINEPSIDDLVSEYVSGYFEKLTLTEFNLIRTNDSFDTETHEYSEYYINTDYNITYFSDELISITFQGMLNYKTAAHPNHLFFTLNIDREAKQRIIFKDNYDINCELYDIFSNYARNNIVEKAGEWPENWGSFPESICSFEEFERGMSNENEFFSYYTNEGIGISYQVPFALGNHLEVVIPYSEMREFRKTVDGTVS